jgi:hypothetical protein
MFCDRLTRLAACLLLSALTAPAAEEQEEEGLSAEVEIPVSIGQVLKGMRLPHYDKDQPDKLSLRFNAESAQRTSENEFTFKGLLIEVFEDSPEEPALQVILNDAVFDRTTNQLKSIDRAKIKGEQFEIIGRQLEFDAKTRNSRLAGPVFMTITDLDKPTNP